MKFFNLFLSFCLLWCSPFQALAQEKKPIDLSKQGDCFHLAPSALILEDDSSQQQFQDILQLPEKEFFRPSSNIPYLDFTRSTFWMKVAVENPTDQELNFFLETARALTNHLTLYILNEKAELIDSLITGDDFPFSQRFYNHRNFIFPLNFPAQSKRILLIKAKSDGEILKFPLKIYSTAKFLEFSSMEHFFLGLYYGFLVLVFILFAFFGFALKQRLYSYFVFYVFFLGLFQFSLDGLAYQYLWPESPWMGNHAILIFAAFSILSLLVYADAILEFYHFKGLYYKIYRIFYGIAFLGLIGSFTEGTIYALTFPVLNGFSLLMSFYFFIGIYLKYRKGEGPGLVLTAAFIFLWLGAIVFVATNINLFNNEFLAANALKIGSAAEVTFLSIAMAARYRKNQKEKINAQKMSYQRLEEINLLKNEQTQKLEKQVKERTSEISDKNVKLNQQNKEIINSINYAKRLQNAILPSPESLKSYFKDASVLFLPKDIVSGDFYWLEKTDQHLFFAVADCTGHGVPGAMVSVVGYNALNKCINELKLRDPAKILDQMTILVEQTFSKHKNTVSDGMDICLCTWDYNDKIEFAGAFNPLYLIRNGELIEYKGNKQPIGKFIKREAFRKNTIQIKPGDTFCLFSDGYADQFGGEKGKKLKYATFKKYLLELNQYKANEMVIQLNQRFEKWKGEEEQVDDICVMLLKF